MADSRRGELMKLPRSPHEIAERARLQILEQDPELVRRAASHFVYEGEEGDGDKSSNVPDVN